MENILSIGTEISNYKVVGLIDSDGEFPVWKIEDSKQTPYALKLIPKNQSRELRQKFDLIKNNTSYKSYSI